MNLAILHAVPRAYSDVGTRPNSHTASDFSATYSLAKSFSERHEESLRPMVQCAQSAKRWVTVKCREGGAGILLVPECRRLLGNTFTVPSVPISRVTGQVPHKVRRSSAPGTYTPYRLFSDAASPIRQGLWREFSSWQILLFWTEPPGHIGGNFVD